MSVFKTYLLSCSSYYLQVRHLTWRGCAGHLTWRLTTPRVADYVRNKSGRIKWSRDPAWACNHCPEHLDNMATYRDVFQHVEDECVPFFPSAK